MKEHVIYDSESETADIDYGDERCNLDRELNGTLLIVADLGLWDGRHSAYKKIEDANLNQILDQAQGDYYKVYAQGPDVFARDTHHDGYNVYRFRLVKDEDKAEELCRKLANQEKVTEEEIDEATEGLASKVQEIYGWKEEA